MRHSRMVVIALCGALSLAGCGGGDDDGDGDSADRAATPTATEAPEESGATGGPEETATPSATAEGETEATLAEQTVKARGEGEATVDIAVTGLQVDGELATLTLSFTPHDPEAAPDTEYSLHDLNGENALFVTLLDSVNLKRYQVVEDSAGNALESRDSLTRTSLDAPVTAQYTFAAPPADVTEIDVSVGDWPTFRDVPIER